MIGQVVDLGFETAWDQMKGIENKRKIMFFNIGPAAFASMIEHDTMFLVSHQVQGLNLQSTKKVQKIAEKHFLENFGPTGFVPIQSTILHD